MNIRKFILNFKLDLLINIISLILFLLFIFIVFFRINHSIDLLVWIIGLSIVFVTLAIQLLKIYYRFVIAKSRRLNKLIKNLYENEKTFIRLKQQVERELILARKTQRKLIPEKNIEKNNYKFILKYVPAQEIGGDYCEIFEIDEDHMGFVIADVSGHGIVSALISSMIKMVCTLSKDLLIEPHLFLKYINYYLYDKIGGHFLTMIAGVLNTKNHFLKVANSGHCLPILIDSHQKTISTLEIYGMCMGVYPDLDYNSIVVPLQKGNRVLFYTDGITETVYKDDELYGEERLIKKLYECMENNLEECIEKILLDVLYHRQQESDDIAILFFEKIK